MALSDLGQNWANWTIWDSACMEAALGRLHIATGHGLHPGRGRRHLGRTAAMRAKHRRSPGEYAAVIISLSGIPVRGAHSRRATALSAIQVPSCSW